LYWDWQIHGWILRSEKSNKTPVCLIFLMEIFLRSN
jgi:hypothetical protein